MIYSRGKEEQPFFGDVEDVVSLIEIERNELQKICEERRLSKTSKQNCTFIQIEEKSFTEILLETHLWVKILFLFFILAWLGVIAGLLYLT